MWGVSLTHPVLASFLCGEFLLHIPCWLNVYVGSFSYTSHADFVFMSGVSLTHPVLPSFLCGEFFYTPIFIFIFIFYRGEFLLHIPCWLHSYVGSFSYTSHADFFMLGVSLTHPVLASFLYGEFLLHIPCWLHFYLGSFSYTSRAVLIFMQGIFFFTSRDGFGFLSRKFLLHIQCFFVVVVVVVFVLLLFFVVVVVAFFPFCCCCSFFFLFFFCFFFLSGEVLLHILF